MSWKHFSSLMVCIILALFLVLGGLFGELYILYAFALAVISVGLGLNSLIITLHTDERMNKIDVKLTQIVDLQEEMQKEHKEQSNSRSPIIPTLQAFSQLYLDYLAKQQTGEQNQKGDRK